MFKNPAVRARAACFYFFVIPGLTYGVFTARMPAIQAQTQASPAEIGYVLLCFGLCGLLGLTLSSPLIRRLGCRAVLLAGVLIMFLALPCCGLASRPLHLALACVVAGIGTGLSEVAMNMHAVQLEARFRAPCMALMHGGYSLGGVCGALASALCARLACPPFWNFVFVLGVYALAFLPAAKSLEAESPGKGPETGKRRPFALPPLFVLLCGLASACGYAEEGTVGEWGSLYLHTVKGAGEDTAALVYAVYACSTVICRLFADRLRLLVDDFRLVLCGGLAAFSGMLLVLGADSPLLCLLGYACVGFGGAPIVPILISRGGSEGGMETSAACALISTLSYGGLLVFPPLIGNLADAFGLHRALFTAPCLSGLLALSSFLFLGRGRVGAAGPAKKG